MVRKYRYRDRQSGISSFDFQPSKMKPLQVICSYQNGEDGSSFLQVYTESSSEEWFFRLEQGRFNNLGISWTTDRCQPGTSPIRWGSGPKSRVKSLASRH